MAKQTLAGRVAIVTGASSGLGAETARAFGRAGMQLALFARRGDRLTAVADEVRASGGQAIVVPGDVRDQAAVAGLVEQTLTAYGRIDVLFGNAGLGRLGWLETLDPNNVRLQIDVNLIGTIDVVQQVLPHLIRQRSGHVILMASLAGKIGTPAYSVYAATKFALAGFCEALRREVAVWGIDVSGMYPSGVATEWADHVGYRHPSWVNPPNYLPLTAEDVARAAVKLVERPRREVILPARARLIVFSNRIAPWVTDWVSRRFVRAERRKELEVES